MVKQLEEKLLYKVEEASYELKTFQQTCKDRFRDVDSALEIRPLDQVMRDHVHRECERTSQGISVPMNKHIETLQDKVANLESDVLRYRAIA